MNVAVTGAHGFLGRDVVRALRASGQGVIELVRQPERSNELGRIQRPYDLAEAPDSPLLDGVDAIVHCAFSRASPRDDAFASNVDGTIALFELARARNIPLLFTSSLSAIPEARSSYGRQKFELERRLSAGGACIVRPGLIVGDGGLVRSLVSTMRLRRVVPLIDGGTQPVQCVWLADVSAIVVALVDRGCPSTTMTVAVEPALTTAEMARDLQRALHIDATLLDVPYAAAYGVARLIESVGLRSPISTESLLGLRASRVQPVDNLETLGVTLTPWADQCSAIAAKFCAVRESE